MAVDHPGAIPWWGGRHPMRADRLAQWTADQMPYRATYAEPFAGMLGVLLSRRPSPVEVVNDLDSRIPVWWRTVRDRSADLIDAIENTPFARAEWRRCCIEQWNPDLPDLERARCVTVAAWQAQRHPGNWPTTMPKARPRSRIIRNIRACADRIRDVRIEQRDALDVLDRLTRDPEAVIFIDPQLEDWGWHKITRQRITVGGEGAHDLAHVTDALWINQHPPAQQLALV